MATKVPGITAQSQRKANPDGRMPLMDHIRELRNRIVKAAAAGILGMVVGLVFFDPIYRFITQPYCNAVKGGCNIDKIGQTLIISGPLDAFYLRIKVAFMIGLGCVGGALGVSFFYHASNLAEFQAIQMWRIEWLLAATASFVAGILLKKPSNDRD